MTIWSPRLPDSDAPIYRRIADALEHDVAAGTLLAGSRLPTHRDLARKLGVTVVTITRAYSEAAQRGLIESTTGRGSFVREVSRRDTNAGEIDLATNVITAPLPRSAAAAFQRAAAALELGYGIGPGSERHRAAGARFLGAEADPARVVVTAGAQQAIVAALAATTKPGDLVLTEAVTYHGIKAIAALLHLRMEGIEIDRNGLVPEAFERRAKQAKALYVTPSLHNPTGSVLPEKRRRAIAAIAAQHGVAIIEDDVYGFLLDDKPKPITAFAPERTLLLTGTGKSLFPALRVGYLLAPDALLPRVQTALAAMTLFTSPVMAELAATWIEDGTAARVIAQKREEIAVRNRVARRILGSKSHERSPHFWLQLPRRWTADTYATESRRRGVRIASASSFAIAEVPNAVRISLGAAASAAELDSAIRTVASVDEGERAMEAVI